MAITYLLYWLFIYSGGENSHNEIWAFKAKFDLEGQGQSSSKTMGILTKVFCTSGPNFVIQAWTGDEVWYGQSQNGVTLNF